MTHCPHCGHDLTPPQSVQIDGWTVYSTHAVRPDGTRLHMSSSRTIMVHTIAEAHPEPVRSVILADRAGVKDASVPVLMHRIRALGVPVYGIRGRADGGYRWGPDTPD